MDFIPFFFSASIIPSFANEWAKNYMHLMSVWWPFGPPRKTRLVDLHQRFYTSTGSMTSRRKNMIPIRCFSASSLLGGS